MKIKACHPKLPLSIYIVFVCTVIANVAATIIVLTYFL